MSTYIAGWGVCIQCNEVSLRRAPHEQKTECNPEICLKKHLMLFGNQHQKEWIYTVHIYNLDQSGADSSTNINKYTVGNMKIVSVP